MQSTSGSAPAVRAERSTTGAGRAPAAPGSRGGAWVALQVCTGLAVLVAGGAGPQPRRGRRLRRSTALLLAGVGIGTVISARRDLGDAFSVFPRPRPGAPVADRGAYRVVRHPMYAGLLAQAAAVGIAGSPWALAPTGALAIILDRKAAGEEAMLDAAHADFAA